MNRRIWRRARKDSLANPKASGDPLRLILPNRSNRCFSVGFEIRFRSSPDHEVPLDLVPEGSCYEKIYDMDDPIACRR